MAVYALHKAAAVYNVAVLSTLVYVYDKSSVIHEYRLHESQSFCFKCFINLQVYTPLFRCPLVNAPAINGTPASICLTSCAVSVVKS